MTLDDITGRCPICNQGVAGYTTAKEAIDKPETAMVRCNNGHWRPLVEWNAKGFPPSVPPPPETSTMIQNPEPERDPTEPFDITTSIEASRTSLELLDAGFNPLKSRRLALLRTLTAGLITECEKLRDRPVRPEQLDSGAPHVPNIEYNKMIKRGARNAASAITAFENGMMYLEKALRTDPEGR